MGVLTQLSRLSRRWFGNHRLDDPHSSIRRVRVCRFEHIESRRLMTADLHVAASYYDPASGLDTVPNVFQIEFVGGADGTELTHLRIDGSKDGGPLTFNDAIFDTAAGGLGAYGFNPLKIVSHDGFQVISSQVADGGTTLDVNLQGFKAGMKLVFTIDVDQVLFVDPAPGDVQVDSVDEGAEFQRSHFIADFAAPHYHDITTSSQFWDSYDANFAAADKTSGSHVDLPADRYSDPNKDQSVLTAGAVALAQQIPLPDSISGVVFDDNNLNNHQDPGDPGIGGVTLSLYQFNGTAYVPTGTTTVTDTQGNYKFDHLLPGQYRVVETQPSGYFNVGAEAGTVNGSVRGVVTTPDILSDISLLGGEDSVRNDFAEALPNSISGHVGNDVTGNCETNPNTPGISGVVMHLLDGSGKTIQTTQTDADGNYRFENLPAGTYTVLEEQPAGYLEDDAHAGSAGGVVVNDDKISQIVLGTNIDAVKYDFCEVLPVSISGHVGIDANGDCDTNPNTPPIAGVVIHLLDSSGKSIATTTTDANGNYIFDNLAPATYGVHEDQPAGYISEDSDVGSAGGISSDADTITQVVLTSGIHAAHYNFCELLPVSISGHVGDDVTGDCETIPDTPPIAGVVIHLLDANGHSIATTTTDASGNYIFNNLAPGAYGIHEDQPAGYFSEDSDVGSAGGVSSDVDTISNIVLTSGVHALHYNFCEVLPVGISGYVHLDTFGDCQDHPEDPPLAGVTIQLLDASGTIVGTTTTNEQGYYSFDGLRPGTYGVHEVQPAGYFDGDTHVGSAGGVLADDLVTEIVLFSGVHGTNYNFCETPPASISGQVHARYGNACDVADGATPIAGVTIQLLNSQGAVIATTTTDAQGNYQFDGLVPGSYSVQEVQPAGYFEGDSDVGSAGGHADSADRISAISLAPAAHALHYDFCEIPPASIAGYVFQDGAPILVEHAGDIPDVKSLRNGKLTPDDTRLAGVTLELRDGVTGLPILGSAALPGFYAADQPITAVTDSNGHYEFRGLPPGVYGVFDVKPTGYLSGIDTAGSLGGVIVSTYVVTDPAVLQQLVVQPQDDAILQISLLADYNSINNNFSVVTTTVLPTVTYFVFPQPPVFPTPNPPPAVMAAAIAPLGLPIMPLPLLVPNLVSSSSGMDLYTWHLSVVDAGLPRGVDQNEAIVQLTSVDEEDLAWMSDEIGNLSEGEWLLASDARTTLRSPLRKLTFGLRNGIPVTGDFNGDGKTDFGVFKDGQWFIDLNANGVWDAGDLWAKLGHKGDRPVTGDWDGDGKTDIGIFGQAWIGDPRAIKHEPGLPDPHNENTDVHKNIPRPASQAAQGTRKLKLTSTGKSRADLIDHVFLYGSQADHPAVGDWNGDGTATIAVFRDGTWWRDKDGNGKRTPDEVADHFGKPGDLPVVGDFNGDGTDEIGIYRDGMWFIDTNNNGHIDRDDQVFQLGGKGDKPVVGDWNGDGRAEPGVYHDTATPLASGDGE